MNKNIIIVILILFAAGNIFSAGKAPGSLLSVEYGVVDGFNLDTNKLGVGHLFGLGLILSDSLEASFAHVMADGTQLRNYNLLRLNLYIKEKVAFSLSMGAENSNNLVTGLGLIINLFQKQRFGITTAFQLRFDYLITRSVNTTGTLMVGLSAKLGI